MHPSQKQRLTLPAVAVFLVCSTLLQLAQGDETAAETLVHQASSEFNRSVLVVDRGGFRAMRFGSLGGEDQTRVRRGHPEQLPMPYLQSAAAGLALPKTLRRALVIGLGGGAFPRFLQARLPDVRVDAVEIDPVVARIARSHFGLTESRGLKVHVMDAVDYVQQDHPSYDYILLDAYDADDLPDALTTSEFLDNVKSRLAGDGVLVVNIAIRSDYRTRWLIGKFTSRYANCLQLRSRPSLNDVLLLTDAAIPPLPELQQAALAHGVDKTTRRGIRWHTDAAVPCT
jgi:spermidine synthase